MIELGGSYGAAFRFCPLEHAAGKRYFGFERSPSLGGSSPLHEAHFALRMIFHAALSYICLSALTSHVDHVQQFVRLLGGVLKIVDSTVAARASFEKLKSEYPSLALLPVHKWAGVGAVW